MLIKERVSGVEHYLSVESNYKDPSQGKGMSDGVVFEMGRLENGIDACVIVSADAARAFAESILQTCDEIEGREGNKMIYTKIEIAPGVELNIDVDPDELYTTCPNCGVEHRLEYETIEELKGDWTSSTTCRKQECADRLKERIANGEFD